MEELLFLCHRIPYPPNKGDKIRAYHWLRHFAEHYRVHLGTFVDDPADAEHENLIAEWTASHCCRPLSPFLATLRSARGLLSGEALSFAFYRDRTLQRWVDCVLDERPVAAIVVFSSTMAPYVISRSGHRRVLDFVDVDSDKWRQYVARHRRPMRWIYAREAARLERGERALARCFDASVFVSPAEARLFCQIAPESRQRVHAVGNGVDTAYFDPEPRYPDPYERPGQAVVFTGAMDYSANIDAVCWFVREIWPRVRAIHTTAVFYIVGARPTRDVLALTEQPGVHVTGTVTDIRPYLARASVAVAPLRIARGIQNKVLEALAMDRYVVMTPQAAAGLHPTRDGFAAVTESAEDFAATVIRRLDAGDADAFRGGRDYVRLNYAWREQFACLHALMRPAAAAE